MNNFIQYKKFSLKAIMQILNNQIRLEMKKE